MKQIPLTKGMFAIVDDDKFEFLNQWNWYPKPGRYGFYAVRDRKKSDGEGRSMILMHRVILGATDGLHCDHIDGNPLNNVIANLRLVTLEQNRYAFQTPRKNKTSNYRGVSFHKRHRKWYASYGFNRKVYFVGLFHSQEDAAKARDEKVKQVFGDVAQLNFS